MPGNLTPDAPKSAADDGLAMLRSALGDEVVGRYVRAAHCEQEEFDRIVTGYGIRQGFEHVFLLELNRATLYATHR